MLKVRQHEARVWLCRLHGVHASTEHSLASASDVYLLTISKRYQQPVDILGVGGVRHGDGCLVGNEAGVEAQIVWEEEHVALKARGFKLTVQAKD